MAIRFLLSFILSFVALTATAENCFAFDTQTQRTVCHCCVDEKRCNDAPGLQDTSCCQASHGDTVAPQSTPPTAPNQASTSTVTSFIALAKLDKAYCATPVRTFHLASNKLYLQTRALLI
jgi:hypothetical protein